jgi:hypothetical protein
MSDLEARLAKLDTVLAKLEHVKLDETVKSLESRIREFESGREASIPVPPLGPALKALVAGAVALVVPISTIIHGSLAERRQQLATEHEIVKAHLDDVLGDDAADVYDLRHLRHLRFLKMLTPENAKPDHDDLKSILGVWAQHEYSLKMRQIESQSGSLADKINRLRVDIRRDEAELSIDRGWFDQENIKWIEKSLNPDDDLVQGIQDNFSARQAKIDDQRMELEKMEDDWARLLAARGLERQTNEVLLEPIEYLKRRCADLRGDMTPREREDRLADCVLGGRFSYYLALEGTDVHAKYAVWLNEAHDHFERACNMEWGQGCWWLAECYRRRHVSGEHLAKLEPPFKTELELFQRAAEHHYPPAHNSLGWKYLEGEGVEKNVQFAENLFIMSCNYNVLNACDSLGTSYQLSADTEKAEKWFKYACDGGEVRGCVNLINLKLDMDPSSFEMPTSVGETDHGDRRPSPKLVIEQPATL